MKHQRAVARERLDERLKDIPDLTRPAKGWIRAVRDALGVPGAVMARRMGISQPGVPRMERAEQDLAITLGTLMRAADALDCDLVYAFVPRTSLDETVMTQARRKAAEQVRFVTHHSRLEDQEPSRAELERQINELANDLIDRRGLWTDAPGHS